MASKSRNGNKTMLMILYIFVNVRYLIFVKCYLSVSKTMMQIVKIPDFKPHVTMASWLTPTEKAKAFQIPCGHPAEI